MDMLLDSRKGIAVALLLALPLLALTSCGMGDDSRMKKSNSGNLFVSDSNGNAISMFSKADPASDANSMNMNGSPGMGMGMGGMGMMSSAMDMRSNSAGMDGNTCANSCHHNPAAADGSLVADRMVAGSNTALSTPGGITVDTVRHILYVADPGRSSILAYDHSESINGNMTPSRIITGSELRHPNFITVADDKLYVADSGSQAILVFAGASHANGDTNATQSILGDSGNNSRLESPQGICVNTGTGVIYVANIAGASVSILGFAANASGNTAASQVYSTTLTSAGGIGMDSTSNELYLADPDAGAVMVFSNIGPMHSGAIAPSRSISVAGAERPADVFLDKSHNVLFVTDPGARTVWVVENASAARGAMAALPIRWMNVQSPFGVFVDRGS